MNSIIFPQLVGWLLTTIKYQCATKRMLATVFPPSSIFNKFLSSCKKQRSLLLTCINFYSAHRSWKIGLERIVDHQAMRGWEQQRRQQKNDDYKKTIYSNGKQAFAFVQDKILSSFFLNDCQNAPSCHLQKTSPGGIFSTMCRDSRHVNTAFACWIRGWRFAFANATAN